MSLAQCRPRGRLQRVLTVTTLVLLLLDAARAAHASLPDDLNALRLRGCGGRPGGNAPLHPARKLNDAARRLAGGAALPEAISAAGYSARSSAEMHLSSAGGEHAAMQLIEGHFCAQVTEPAARDVGIAQSGQDTWIVLAAPLVVPLARDAAAISRRVLALVNTARAQARRCGHEQFDAAGALELSAALGDAALAHSLDMAQHGYFDHTGADGSTPATRVTRAGYAWRLVGENLASGMPTPEEAVAGWLQSPAHCHNLMDPRFTDMGVGFTVDPKSPYVIYWTQLFAEARAAAR
ncbi:MAG TPA: CAP domain-containing protein [Steroidobacteraceae bacterium]